MKSILTSVLCVFCVMPSLTAQENYHQLWDALNKNDRAKASQLILAAPNDPAAGDSYITGIYLQAYNGKEQEISDFDSRFYDKVQNPYPYIYALWFNKALLGTYGKKKYPHQLRLADKLITDPKAPGTIAAAAHYQKGTHFMFSNQLEKASKEYAQIGNICNWQYVGPFENLSESGFYKNYGPLEHPEPEAIFTSSTNAPIQWITPAEEIKDGWTPVCFQINKSTAVVYAQTFISVPNDMEVYCNSGVTGALKIWLNDGLLISEYKEKTTEMDTYTVKCRLKKGVNRLLVQLSYTGERYPNFGIRLTDEQYQRIPTIAGSNIYQPYSKATDTGRHNLLPLFAEAFFTDKITTDPDNLVNYLLLCDVYLRNTKTLEARNTIEAALKKAPGNSLLRMKLLEILIKENNRSVLLEEIEKIKKADPESLIALEINIKQNLENEKYDDAAKLIIKRKQLYGEDETTFGYELTILAHEQKYDEMVKAAEDGYRKYPELETLLPMMYSIKKDVYKDNKGALKLYDNYLKTNLNAEALKKYAVLLQEQGQPEKSLQQKQLLAQAFPYDPYGYSDISAFYYGTKDYSKADEYTNKALKIAPYNADFWEQLGDIKSETRKNTEAINAYNKSLQYDPNQYGVINKLRKLNGQPESYKLIPETDIDQLIKDDNPSESKNADYGYYFIRNEKSVIMHPGGATEEYYLLAVKITNEKGIDKYKESSIGYSGTQELLIEKAEVIKKTGAKIEGERNNNDIVFTNLEAGDIIVFKYRIQNYVYGRFAKEYWDKFYFNGQIYTATTRYNILLPKDRELNYVFSNSNIKPVITEVENFKQYSWENVKQAPMKDEPLMPNNCDVGPVLHISTVPGWQDIATWYSDIVNNKTEEDYEVTALFKNLFPADKQQKLTEFQQAKTIYDYIEKNIRYSSVSFRQSAFVPQSASITLNTRLGDCKDLSNLFTTLCRMANIECRMVLVDTRDNGAKDILLPSVEFNHCIVKARLDNKEYYIELTDNYLPFASLPNNLKEALILEIPDRKSSEKSSLKPLETTTRTKDVIKRVINIKPVESDLSVQVRCIKSGHFSSGTRADFSMLDYDKQVQEMDKLVAGSYKNNIKIDTLSFADLTNLEDSVDYRYSYVVKNEVSEIGSLQTFRVTYPDVVASLNNFSAESRVYPVEYNTYEDADRYETIVHIEVPQDKKFVELPANETWQFKNLSFSITYQLVAPNKLTVTRKFDSDRKVIAAEDYVAFKHFFEKIIKAEQKFIAFK